MFFHGQFKFILHVRRSLTLRGYFSLKEAQVRFEPRPFLLHKNILYTACKASDSTDFAEEDAEIAPFGPYFSSLLGLLQCNERQCSGFLRAINTLTPYSGEFYGDILHKGITYFS